MLDEKGDAMKKTLMALAAVATLAVSSVAAPAPAHAQRGIGAAIAGGIIGGAIVGGALAGPGYYGPGYGYYGPGYGYYGRPAYYADDYYGGLVWRRPRLWGGYGWGIFHVGGRGQAFFSFCFQQPPAVPQTNFFGTGFVFCPQQTPFFAPPPRPVG